MTKTPPNEDLESSKGKEHVEQPTKLLAYQKNN